MHLHKGVRCLFLTIWHYLNGYVIVEVSGFALERFMNLIINRNIEVWDLNATKDHISFKIMAADFKALKPIVKKSRCHIHIRLKKGLPFMFHRYKRRKMIPSGAGPHCR